MRHARRFVAALSGTAFLICGLSAPPALAVILTSGDTSQPSTTTNYAITGSMGGPTFPNVSIVEDIGFSPGAGPWHKNLVNNTTSGPGGLASGTNVAITETLSNLGGVPWTSWNEKVLTRTTIGSPNDAPGFQFRQGSVAVQADYGAGFVPLTQGVDYTVIGTPAPGPGNDPNGWESLVIQFFPGAQINPSNKLQIKKDIFESFGDGNTWVFGEAAEIGQFPGVPEPASLTLCAIGAVGMIARRRRVR
jgi:hypothetical protein